MGLWTIGELARQAGLRPSTLRYYDSLSLLSPLKREAGQRRYDASALDRLKLIRTSQQAGFTLKEIRSVLADSGDPHKAWQALVPKKLLEVQATIDAAQASAALLQAGMDCECKELQDCELVN
ncbi:MAG: MerR family transcriptional regulator [Chloroflexi bacterium]|nr:MAG: MerR family transcriptional regulator [Chloroflexota bacterium]MBL1195969.1 MerR family transcriptional regulator [Chloroflexota bacterium]NOH13263.1 MerR family transcriptional regulator [Chloroflexota bacterium]